MAITRRGFMGLCAGGAATLAFGAGVRVLGGNEALVRPPLVLDEADFISRCVRCYRCVSVCPTNVIDVARIEDGLLEVKTPKMNFHRGYCDFCNKCVEACPTAALSPADPEHPEKGRMGVAVVDSERCVAFYNGCDVCVQKCPYGAISANEFGQPVVDDTKCNGCGVCTFACPALVYRSYGGTDARGIEVLASSSAGKGA